MSAGGALSVIAALTLVSLRQPQGSLDAHALDARRVVVAPFENATGDSTLAVLGRMAVDRINQGLSDARVAEVFEPLAACNRLSRPKSSDHKILHTLSKYPW
jgi:hypothetical protein